jgi:hypothetical protein
METATLIGGLMILYPALSEMTGFRFRELRIRDPLVGAWPRLALYVTDAMLRIGGLEFGDVDVEIADRINLELFLHGPTAFDLRQSADAMTLEAAMQG